MKVDGFKYITESNEQLDAILRCLNYWHKEMVNNIQPNGKGGHTWVVNNNNQRSRSDLISDLITIEKASMQIEDLTLALLHLEEEKLIKFVNKDFGLYMITFTGKVLIENGGYTKKQETTIYEMNKAKRAEWMISRGAIFAACFSGLLLALELIKFLKVYYYPLFPFFH